MEYSSGCGIVAVRANTTNLGLTGIPLFIAVELLLYGRGEQTHEEKMMHLGKTYGWLRSFLMVKYEKTPDKLTEPRIPVLDKEGNVKTLSINDVLMEASREIENMYAKYQPSYEGNKSCTGSEKEFIGIMRAVFERLAVIIAFAGIVDKMSTSEEVLF